MKCLIVERDGRSPLDSNGPVIFECLTRDSDFHVPKMARDIAKGGQYGRVWIGRVGELAEVCPETGKAGPAQRPSYELPVDVFNIVTNILTPEQIKSLPFDIFKELPF